MVLGKFAEYSLFLFFPLSMCFSLSEWQELTGQPGFPAAQRAHNPTHQQIQSAPPFPISLALTPSDSASLIFKKSGKIKDELATIQQTLQTDYQLPIFPFFLTNKIPNPFMATMCPARKLHFPASLATTDHVTPLQKMIHLFHRELN